MSFILADVQSIELKSRLLFYSERTGDKTEYWVQVIIEQPLGEYFFKEGLTLLTHLTNSTCYFSLWREANLL